MMRNTILNGKTGDRSIIRPWIDALNNPRIVTEKAGFLFKVSAKEERMELAVSPCLINGERLYHYDMHLEREDAYTLIGDVNAAGLFTILFKPESLPLGETQKAHYARSFRRFATLLLEQGYSGEGRLNEVTQAILSGLGLSPAPQTLEELSKAF